MLTWLLLGFLLGLQHALEADHIAAVTALSAERRGKGDVIRHGVIWGSGHALMLGVVGGVIYALQLSMDVRLATALECAVGVMMIALGTKLFFLIMRDRIHFHAHRHATGEVHFHAHSHARDVRNHNLSRHSHRHAAGGWKRSFAVGIMHGLAGSAALVALAASSSPSIPLGVTFRALFGFGSVAGMAMFSAVIAIPLTYAASAVTWATHGIQALAGIVAIGIGLHILVEAAGVLLS